MSVLGPIYAITDPVLLPGERLFSAVRRALSAGVRTIQLRDKTASIAQLTPTAIHLTKLCEEYGGRCIVNDSVEVALASGAHGVHLGQSDGSIAEARAALGNDAIIGVTCHADVALARRAQAQGADYVAFGRFFSSHTKPLAGAADVAVLQHAAAEIALPIIAIGGIGRDNMAPLLRAGAHTLAVCHSLFGQEDIETAAAELLAAYQSHCGN